MYIKFEDKSEENIPLARPRRRLRIILICILQKCCMRVWIQMSQNRVQWCALVNTAINILIS